MTSVGSVIVAIARASRRTEEPMLPSNFGTGGHCFAVAALGYEASEPPRWCSLGNANTDAEVRRNFGARCDRAGASCRRHKRFEVVG